MNTDSKALNSVKLRHDLKNLYVRAENLMLKSEELNPLQQLLSKIDSCFQVLINALPSSFHDASPCAELETSDLI